jgi:hypothetical protein
MNRKTESPDNYLENHYINRSNWLRAAVLGANDGILSTSSLAIGIAAASTMREPIILASLVFPLRLCSFLPDIIRCSCCKNRWFKRKKGDYQDYILGNGSYGADCFGRISFQCVCLTITSEIIEKACRQFHLPTKS